MKGANMKLSQYISEIAMALVIIGAVATYTDGRGLGFVMLGLILGIVGIIKAPTKKKRIIGIIAVVCVPLVFVLLFVCMVYGLF